MRGSQITTDPPIRMLRQFAVAALVAACLASGWLLWNEHVASAAAVLTMGTVAGLLGFLRPRWLRWPYVALSALTFPIAWTISHLLLAIIYFGVITPLGMTLRCCGHRPLEWRRRTDQETYWEPRPLDPEPKSYLRQY